MQDSIGFQITEDGKRFLARNWRELTAAAPANEAEKTFEELARLYSSRGRAYHNLAHLEMLLREAERLAPAMEEPASVRFAIWFHDAIYRTRRKDNEARSAELAAARLEALCVSAATASAVCRMIEATQRHDGRDLSDDGRLFLDLDLSILGRDPDTYDRYRRAIRAEYRWVPAFLYRRERKKVLEQFLGRERLYFTSELAEIWEAAARRNLQAEIVLLS